MKKLNRDMQEKKCFASFQNDIACKVDELVEFVDGLQKVAEKQETVK